MMMQKNDQKNKLKKHQIYGSGMIITSLILLVGLILITPTLKSQDLEAPVPSITIEEEDGASTSFGDELTIEEDLPPLPEKEASNEETQTNSTPSSDSTIKKEDSEEEIQAIGGLNDSGEGWDTWEVTEEDTQTTTDTKESSNEEVKEPSSKKDGTTDEKPKKPRKKKKEKAEKSKDDSKVVAPKEDESVETVDLEVPTEKSPSEEGTPLAVGRIKDSEGKDITPAPKTPTEEENTDTVVVEETPNEVIAEETISEENTTQTADSEPKATDTATTGENSGIVAAPQAPTPPKAPEVSSLDALDPPTVSASNTAGDEPSLGDLPIGTMPQEVPTAPMDRDENKEVEIAKLIRQLEEEAANKEVAKSSLVPNQMQDEINFDNVPIGAAFRLLAEQAGFNFVEPPFQEGETLSLRFQKMTPLDAFMKIAQARGFAVVTENGFTTLKRPDIALPEFYEVKKYRLKYIQPKWIIQSVANLLEIQISNPADTLASFPEPNEDATSYGGSNDGNSGGGGGTTQNGTGGASANGSQNIGLPTAPRWTSSLPYDEPLHAGQGAQGGEVPFIFVDRTTSSLVVKTTKEKQKMVGQYIATVDKPEPQIMIETKVVEITMGDLLEYGTDWSDALGKGITVNWQGTRVNLADVFNGGGTGTWSAFLTIPEASITIRAFQEMDNGSVMNMPRTMTRSGVPVSISSTITDATPAYQLATGTGGTGAVSTPSGFNTFTTGLTIDVVPQILENGMIDININPTVANQVGERTIEANVQTGTPKQTIPIISSRSLTTSAMVPSGMTIMLGGIVETRNSESSGGVPILSRIPVLGKTVFGNMDKEDTRKTLIVFVTPKVIYPDEYQKVWTSEEEWRAMIDGNRANIQTYNDKIPEPLEIRKAIPIKDTLNQRGTPRNKK